MSANTFKTNKPNEFNGSYDQAEEWLARLQLWNFAQRFTRDEEKIATALSFMTQGSALSWAQEKINTALTTDTNGDIMGFGTWANFLTEWKKQFQPADMLAYTMTKIQNLKQKGTAEEYVTEFRPLASRTRVTEIAIISKWFLDGLNGPLRDNCIHQELPATMEDLYSRAIRLDSAWRSANMGKRPQQKKTI